MVPFWTVPSWIFARELTAPANVFVFAEIEPGIGGMSEHSQLASAMLVLAFAAGMFIAGQMFTGYQSTRVAASSTFVASFPW